MLYDVVSQGCVVFGVFFFFKQKTAYEMRISDWSSDVCSSDLLAGGDIARGKTDDLVVAMHGRAVRDVVYCDLVTRRNGVGRYELFARYGSTRLDVASRSEEHTSELQSLMRISYAVFCLKKKKIINQRQISTLT